MLYMKITAELFVSFHVMIVGYLDLFRDPIGASHAKAVDHYKLMSLEF